MIDVSLLAAQEDVPGWLILLVAIFIVGGGVFSIWGAVANWDWFFDDYKAERFVRIIGRMGTRILFGVLGVFVILMGLGIAALAVASMVVDQ